MISVDFKNSITAGVEVFNRKKLGLKNNRMFIGLSQVLISPTFTNSLQFKANATDRKSVV